MKKLPNFKNEDETRKFWANNSPLDYLESKKLRLAGFPNLKPSSRTISIRLPESLLKSTEVLARKKDVPYQAMRKMLLAEAVREELVSSKKRVASG